MIQVLRCTLIQDSFVTEIQCKYKYIYLGNCTVGQKLNTDTNLCEECALGSYQPDKWQESCIECSSQRTTVDLASVSADQCLRKF